MRFPGDTVRGVNVNNFDRILEDSPSPQFLGKDKLFENFGFDQNMRYGRNLEKDFERISKTVIFLFYLKHEDFSNDPFFKTRNNFFDTDFDASFENPKFPTFRGSMAPPTKSGLFNKEDEVLLDNFSKRLDRLESRLKRSLEERMRKKREEMNHRFNNSHHPHFNRTPNRRLTFTPKPERNYQNYSPSKNSRRESLEKEYVRNARNEISVNNFDAYSQEINNSRANIRRKEVRGERHHTPGRRNIMREEYERLYDHNEHHRASISPVPQRRHESPMRQQPPNTSRNTSFNRSTAFNNAEEYYTPNRKYSISPAPRYGNEDDSSSLQRSDKYQRFKQKYENKAVNYNRDMYIKEYTARGATHYPDEEAEKSQDFHPAMTRKYSYGNLSSSFLNRIANNDFYNNNGTSFINYLKECKGDLELAFRAQQSLRSRPLSLPQVHLYHATNSK